MLEGASALPSSWQNCLSFLGTPHRLLPGRADPHPLMREMSPSAGRVYQCASREDWQ